MILRMDSATLGKILVGVGAAVVLIGAAVWLFGRFGLPLGQLPGDIRIERGKSSFYFPIVTCIVLSVLLTVLVNLALRLFR